MQQYLINAQKQNQINHAWLFTGEKAFAKAREFAMALNCENPTEQGLPCQKCLSCRKISHYNHPDVFFIKPDGNSVKIEQTQNINHFAHLGHYESPYKIFIIDQANKLTTAAANNILVLLEEPPPKTIFILVAPSSDNILPTIISRCQQINFAQIKISLEENAKTLANDAKIFALELPKMPIEEVLNYASRWDFKGLKPEERQQNRENVKLFLQGLQLYLYNIAITPFNNKKTTAAPFSPAQAQIGAEALENCGLWLKQNINQRLMLDTIFLKLKKILTL